MTGRTRSKKTRCDKRVIWGMMIVLVPMILFVAWRNLFEMEALDAVQIKDKNARVYASFLENGDYAEDFGFADEVRYELVYIDDDEMPELLLAEGNRHVDRVAVYRYNEKEAKVEFLASFSSFGSMQYIPKGNTIISQYGNHGYYFEVYSEIDGTSVKRKDIFLSDASKTERKYYHGFPVSEKFTGGFGKPNTSDEALQYLQFSPEEYQITEAEYNKRREKVATGVETVRFDEMKLPGDF